MMRGNFRSTDENFKLYFEYPLEEVEGRRALDAPATVLRPGKTTVAHLVVYGRPGGGHEEDDRYYSGSATRHHTDQPNRDKGRRAALTYLLNPEDFTKEERSEVWRVYNERGRRGGR